uniref:Uncharacterized protein n=1 Tax=Brassica campestris TaxID=3711 RepID=A0A3P6C5E8_BRACM|nr:unnamed protein product [Brassica rapa]
MLRKLNCQRHLERKTRNGLRKKKLLRETFVMELSKIIEVK